jgi:hypothetical protein
MCCQRRHQAPNTERLKSQQMPSSAITDSGMCWQKRLEAPETTWPKSQQVPSSAIADSGKCWQKSLEAPDTTKLCNLQPSSASAGLGNVQVERPRKKKVCKGSNQRTNLLPRKQHGESPRRGTLPCGDQGPGAQVQLERSIPFMRPGTLSRCEHGTNWPRQSRGLPGAGRTKSIPLPSCDSRTACEF